MTMEQNREAKRRGRLRWLAMGFALVTPLLMARPAQAYECPKHIASAQATLDKLHDLMKTMKGKMPARDIRFVHGILDDARMFIGGAKHNHQEALGYRDHVNAIIRAHQARGHVVAERVAARIRDGHGRAQRRLGRTAGCRG